MSDIFCETIVKKKVTSQDLMKKVLAIVISALLIAIGILFIPFFSLIIIMVVVAFDYFFFKRLNIEYEYALTMTDLDVAKIMSKEKRKQLMTLDLKQADIIAPVNHPKVKDVISQGMKVVDCSSGEAGRKVYTVVTKQDGKMIQLLFEPSETMIKGIRTQFPSKTILE